jgi:hypothetical protein
MQSETVPGCIHPCPFTGWVGVLLCWLNDTIDAASRSQLNKNVFEVFFVTIGTQSLREALTPLSPSLMSKPTPEDVSELVTGCLANTQTATKHLHPLSAVRQAGSKAVIAVFTPPTEQQLVEARKM